MTPDQEAQLAGWPPAIRDRFRFHVGRNARQRAAGARDLSIGLGPVGGSRHDWANGMAGLAEDFMAGRLAVARNESARPDGGLGDLVTDCGLRVDVKWSPTRTARLMCPAALAGHLRADLYALVTGEDPARFLFAGWLNRAGFLAAPVSDVGYGATLIVPQAALLPAAALTTPVHNWW